MPRFYFHVRDGVNLPDEEGTELEGWHAAQIEALRLAGNLISENASMLKLGEDWSMVVTDRAGLVLFQLDFHIAGSPAVTSKSPIATG